MVDAPNKNKAPMLSVILGIISLGLAVTPILGGLPRLLPFPSYSILAVVLAVPGVVLGTKYRKADGKTLALAGLLLCSVTLLVSLGFALFLGSLVFSLHGL